MEQERLLDTLPDADIEANIQFIRDQLEIVSTIADEEVKDRDKYAGDVAAAVDLLLKDQEGHRRVREAMERLLKALEEERDNRAKRRQDGSQAV